MSHKKCWCSEWAWRVRSANAEDSAHSVIGMSRSAVVRLAGCGEGAAAFRPGARHKRLLLGGAAKAVVRG